MQGHGHGPSTFDKMKVCTPKACFKNSTDTVLQMGAMMGVSVGCCVGLLFGGFNVLRYGPGPQGFLRTIGQNMAASAAMFGGFMSIGSVIRTEELAHQRSATQQWRTRRIIWDTKRNQL